MRLTFQPLTPKAWPDFERLFGSHGAYGGCWCMWWRLTRRQFTVQQGDGNRRAMKRRVESGEVPGILAFDGNEPAGWCSIAPREHYSAVERSRILRRLDDLPVWSIVCLYIARPYRDQGVAQALIKAAVAHARRNGARVIEAYPTVPRQKTLPPVSSFMGVPSLFARAGFEEAARPSPSRMIMRKYLYSGRRAAYKTRPAGGGKRTGRKERN